MRIMKKHRKNLTTLAKVRLIELKSLKQRHKELVKYLDNHNSSVGKIPTLQYLPEDVAQAEVDKQKAMRDLIDRPEACKPEGYCEKQIEQEKQKEA
ncbi:hypothetical protein AKJ51_00105 [candidate division MSBL1 archaeon SCGC-AAA382A20]|uniref:Uncharacterized protein n=1 Tax=candidate division MSBL1 archaeon SCGC-AAA382A20 TaxID=1698280 RepID=A0A133VMV3_9EURY|nr:hypothetical protein AKJ51_00105 [candidate division MSBL1 archaeon SCGC-AAA382A20]